MERPCRRCGQLVVLTPTEIARRKYICAPCNRKLREEYRARRMAAGLPKWQVFSAAAREYNSRYATSYHKRPDVMEMNRKRARQRREDPAEQVKGKARLAVRNAIRAGRLSRGACEVCGGAKAHAHHDDYSRPLDVRWLCPKHHRQHHVMMDADRRNCDRAMLIHLEEDPRTNAETQTRRAA